MGIFVANNRLAYENDLLAFENLKKEYAIRLKIFGVLNFLILIIISPRSNILMVFLESLINLPCELKFIIQLLIFS